MKPEPGRIWLPEGYTAADLRLARKMIRRVELEGQPFSGRGRWLREVHLVRLMIGLALVRFFERLRATRPTERPPPRSTTSGAARRRAKKLLIEIRIDDPGDLPF